MQKEIEKPAVNTDLTFGQNSDVYALARRIKTMVPGGGKLADNEAMALAQVSMVTKLNPFIGEIWYIPGKGPMIGIKGARRMEQESADDKKGYSFPTFTVVPPEEAGANETQAKDCAAAFKCEINDSAATQTYLKMYAETLSLLRAAGATDPVAEARQIVGPRPVWVGYGFSTRSEESRMNKVQLAQKRAEADSLKKKIIIPFGAEISSADTATEYVDAKSTDIVEVLNQKDAVTDATWTAWVSVAERADKVSVPHSSPKRETVTNTELLTYTDELLTIVFDVESQARS